MDELARVREAADPLDRVLLATDAVSTYQDAIAELGQIRRDAVEALRNQGMTLTEIAEKAGVSRARLSQLGTARRPPERVLLSGGVPITLTTDTNKDAERGGIAVPQEHAAAIDSLTRTARRLGLDTNEVEYIVPPGLIDLNRDGLVVLCRPRSSSLLAQMLASDERYGFDHDEDGWYMVDKTTGERFISPKDRGESGDYAYLGALPRPDGKGNWLYMAGIHAAGAAGAAVYLDRELAGIYSEARTSRWSCIIKCEYEPDTHRVTSADLLAPVHQQGRPGRARQPRK